MYDYPNNEADAIKQLRIKQRVKHQGIYVSDPTKAINIPPHDPTTTGQGFTTGQSLWSQITSTSTSSYNNEPFKDPYGLEARLNKLELDNKLLKLKILVLQGKFTEEQVKNIKEMLTSNDEASITVANLILEND